IFAAPTTLTGSIGIFAGKFDLSDLLDLIGINQFTFQRGAFANLYSSATAWDDDDRRQAQKQIEVLYDEFIDRVATGRNMSVPEARSVGEGRVWTGQAALDRGLVDELGGLMDAIDAGKSLAGLDAGERVNIVQVPQRGPFSAIDLGIPTDLLQTLQMADTPPATESTEWPASDIVSMLIDLPRLVL